MVIIGIDSEKCIKCKKCISECPSLLFHESPTNTIEYSDDNNFCILCGHCIAICPTNAILYEKMGDDPLIEDVSKINESISYDTLLQYLSAHRSIRKYLSKKIPESEFQKIFEVMKYAPSSSNGRIWRYKVISDPNILHALSKAISDKFIQSPTLAPVYGEKFKKKIAKGIDPIFYHAPHILILYVPTDTGMEKQNAGIALTYGRIAAETLGIGTCWIGFASLMCNLHKSIQKLTGIRGKILGVITLGYPNITYVRSVPRSNLKIKKLE